MDKNENGLPGVMPGNNGQSTNQNSCNPPPRPGFGENMPPMNGGNGNMPPMNGGNGNMPPMNGNCGMHGCLSDRPLAYVYAPDQHFRMLYSAQDALRHGTLFEELYKPMEVYGRE